MDKSSIFSKNSNSIEVDFLTNFKVFAKLTIGKSKDGSTVRLRSEFAYYVPRTLNLTVPAYHTSVQFLKRTVPTYRTRTIAKKRTVPAYRTSKQ